MNIPCKTCDEGSLEERSPHAFPLPIVGAGYIWVSLGGIGIISIAQILMKQADRATAAAERVEKLRAIAGRAALESGPLADLIPSSPSTGSYLGLTFVVVATLIAITIGLLLTHQKNVLQCGNCGAITARG